MSMSNWHPSGSRRLSRRRLLASAGGAASATALLAACRQSTSKPLPVSGTDAKPTAGGQLSITGNEPTTLDVVGKQSTAAHVLLFTNDRLLTYAAGTNIPYEQMTIQPELAERWEAPDAQTYTFHLRPGVTFANLPPLNGRAMTSDDVRWSFDYLARAEAFKDRKLPPSAIASMLAGLDRIDVPDQATVTLHFAQPFAPFLSYAASQWLPILGHEIFDADGSFAKHAVGMGPFQLDTASTQTGSRWVYKKNPSYFQSASGRPYLDQINDLVLADNATANAAFESKQLDVLDYSGLTLDNTEQIMRRLPSVNRDEHVQTGSYYLYLSLRRPPFNDARVRQAFSLSIDRDAFIKTMAGGKGEWALAAATPGLFTQEEMKQILHHDPAQAKQVLAQAGYASGLELDFTYYPGYGDTFVSVVQLLQAQLKEGGINVNLKPLEHATDETRRRAGDFQLNITPRGQGIPLDLDSYLYGSFYPGAAENVTGVDDPQLTPMLVAQHQEVDNTKRRDLWRQAVRRINEVPWALAIFFGPAYVLRQPYIHDYARNMSDESDGNYVTQVWRTQ